MHAIEQLYNPLFLFVRKRINHQEDAEDITQEVFFKLSKSRNDQVDNLKSWVYTIAKNTITDYYRRSKMGAEEMTDDLQVTEDIENAAVQELSGCIRSYVALLPEEYRMLMTLSELQNVPQKEIAEQLGMNYVTVRSKIQRGRKKLKDMFTDCCTIVQGGKGSIVEYITKEDAYRSSCSDC